MTRTNATKSCPYSPHLGPVGCLPAPNIFPLAKETLAKGKMFWNEHHGSSRVIAGDDLKPFYPFVPLVWF